MKKAIVILYLLLFIQTCCVGLGFVFSYGVAQKTLNNALYNVGKDIGKTLIQICDQRYVLK
jgi:hypothetical protein